MVKINQTQYEEVLNFTDIGFEDLATNMKIMKPSGFLCICFVGTNGYHNV